MVYDCFTFFNELDLLEIRLNTLDAVVDKFVVAEATRTHTGKPKELVFEANKARFAKFAGKIEYILVDDLLSEEEVAKDAYNLAWVNENRQRNALQRGLAIARESDVVLISDLDEIPRPESLLEAKELLNAGAGGVRLMMDAYNFFLNFKNYSCPEWGLGTVAANFGEFSSGRLTAAVRCDRYTQETENAGNTIHKLRFLNARHRLPRAGWHFSYMGGLEAIEKKLAAFSHSEFSSVPRALLEKRLSEGRDLFGRAGISFAVPVDGALPQYIVENKERFAHLLFPVNDGYMRKTRLSRKLARARGALYSFAVGLIPQKAALWIVRARDWMMKRLGRI